ncbi:BBSome complex member BBS7-like [Chironomus tepperi]|uniref:BBSome complex member BBS7-like n=1 Tax=Chironomus tepperi TaxID=113505 RepID=UPI00391F8170
MELELSRVDYALVGITLQNAMKILPTKKAKEQQKVVIGDQDGVVQLFSANKKDEIIVHFKTVPSNRITSVQLGGSIGSVPDKIFIANENQIIGYNRKGKVFLSFDTNLTEPIKSLFVVGNDLIVCGNHVYTHYKECKESGSYLCGDTIVDCNALCPHNTSRVITVLACSGRVLRLLEHCRVRKMIELDSIPTVLHVPKNSLGNKILVGFSDGRVALFRINPMIMEVKQEILIETKENLSAVTCLDTFDLYGDGKEELIIGRRDGTIQVYSMALENNEFDGMDCQQLLYEENFNESISCVYGACVGAAGYTEVIACTYTGKVFGLTTRTIGDTLTDSKSNDIVTDAKQRIHKLKAEIDYIEQAVLKEREKYKISTQALSSGLSAIPVMTVNDTISLSADDATYILSIELPSPIENILVQSDIPLDILDVDSNTAVISRSECDRNDGNLLLCCYRCQLNTNRVDLKFRTVEGQHGTLRVYITPNIQPKCCQLRTYAIHPLSLHIMVHKYDTTRPMNILTLKGNFSQGEMHSWISNCLPEVPERVDSTEENVLIFKNIFIDTYLICKYAKGEAEFKSDNISTISVVKDYLTKEATTRHIKIELQMNINDASIEHFITLVEPKLQQYNEMERNHKILQGLLELNVQNDDEFEMLSDKYKNLLQNKQNVEEKFKNDSSNLNRLIGILIDFYVDKNKFRGINVRNKLDAFVDALKNCKEGTLREFFCESTEKNRK